jgi:ABC-2 type transport system ATP-binding protein
MYAVETKSLTKFYGSYRGISNVSLSINKGAIFGLLGPNGAGKTTFLRLLMNLIKPTSGRAIILGMNSDIDSLKIKSRVGYLQGDYVAYPNLKVIDLLNFTKNLRPSNQTDWNILCERFDLDVKRKIGDLSKGNRQKLGIVQAFMSEPELLILDEPTSGLDPLLQQEFKSLIFERKDRGASVIMSSHIFQEIESMCDKVAVIREGEIVSVENVSSLSEKRTFKIEIVFSKPVEKQPFVDCDGLDNISLKDNNLTCTLNGKVDSLLKTLAKYEVISFQSEQTGLEEMFMSFYPKS